MTDLFIYSGTLAHVITYIVLAQTLNHAQPTML